MAINDNSKSVPDNILTHRKTENKNKESSNNSNVQNSNDCRTVSIFSFSSFVRLVTVPIKYFCKNIVDLFKFIWSLVGFNNNQNNDPVADISSFKKFFENQYGENHPVFFLGSYNQAVTQAKQDLKFLLVYLHNNLHEDTENFCKLTLTHNEVVNYIKRNNLIFWACSIDLNEGYTVSRLMRENTYPFLALVVLKNNKMMIVKKFQGKMTVEKLLSQLQKAIDDNEASLVSTRLERQQRSMDQLIRKQQDQDYLDSLRADQEKDRKRKEERDKKEKEQQEKLKKEQEELNNQQKLIDLKENLKDKILIEPEANCSDVIKLLIKLPNGKKIERRFLKNVSIKYLFYFVFCHPESPLKFIVKTSFPAKELPCLSPTIISKDVISSNNKDIPTFEQFGIKNSEVLYVHDLEA